MIESLKSSEAGADEVYVTPWKFYESLVFLSDALTLQKTKSNENDEDDGSPYVDAKPPSTKTPKKLALVQSNEPHSYEHQCNHFGISYFIKKESKASR